MIIKILMIMKLKFIKVKNFIDYEIKIFYSKLDNIDIIFNKSTVKLIKINK